MSDTRTSLQNLERQGEDNIWRIAKAAGESWDKDRETITRLTRERDELAGEVRRYRDQLARAALARDNAGAAVDDWAGYASPYFREKHDLDGDLLQLRTSAEAIRVLLAHLKPAKPDDGTAKETTK